MIPTWILALLTGLPGYMIIRAFWKRRRNARGCLGCGYDLTGNISGVCPECGAAVMMGGLEKTTAQLRHWVVFADVRSDGGVVGAKLLLL
jgi:hypothetical protein